ncbi:MULTISPECIES: carboxymuconolactone decarboxylase family protein [unclassified Bradyrhizobium]|uniref:carboxymuconolactone decarboxylase family protein n=1 Tax=unclassified Bradyrhizobium TaxID=2631580 RepID=UPI001FF950F6
MNQNVICRIDWSLQALRCKQMRTANRPERIDEEIIDHSVCWPCSAGRIANGDIAVSGLDMHTCDLLKSGVKIEKLALVQAWAEAGNLFDERERAALAWAETVTCVAQTNVPDEAYQAARTVFSERELVDLTIAISLMNAYNRMSISFRNSPQAAVEKTA